MDKCSQCAPAVMQAAVQTMVTSEWRKQLQGSPAAPHVMMMLMMMTTLASPQQALCCGHMSPGGPRQSFVGC